MLNSVLDFQVQYFWKWSYFVDYFYAVVVFIIVGGYLTFMLLEYAIYTEVIGFLAVFTEAMLGVPQFYKNYVNHSTSGMRLVFSIIEFHFAIMQAFIMRAASTVLIML